MSKEIFEQPSTVNRLNEYIDNIRNDINLYDFPIKPKKIDKIFLSDVVRPPLCQWNIGRRANRFNETEGSEFRYRKIKFSQNTLYIFVSQSGEIQTQLQH